MSSDIASMFLFTENTIHSLALKALLIDICKPLESDILHILSPYTSILLLWVKKELIKGEKMEVI